ncbi:hypothetical protein GJAV_G00215850 [Gymnothorax javanicus]|nr:hypothetical protein GJAV_G00215850 [Gymnothorax javanicus]
MAAVAGRVGGPLVSDVETEMEQRWLRVESTALRMESRVPISAPLSPVTPPDEAPLRAIWLGSKGPLPPCPRSDSCQQQSQLNMKQQLDLSAQECSLSPAEILALQAELSNTTAKLIAGASTAAQASREIQTQLEEAEASLQERSRKVQELRERLSDVTASLMATEEAQALERERLQESWEEERQCLQEQLAEVEARRHGLEIRLRAAELKEQAQQREHTDLAHQLAEQLSTRTGTIQDLTATIQRLRDEKDQLTSRCQELLNQITAADSEVNKLQSCIKAREIDKNGQESYQTLYEEFQRVTRVLWEREEQIEEMRGMYERQEEMKQKELNEALDQVSALERELVSGVKQGSTEPCAVQRDLQDKLTAAERRIVDLELELLSMQEVHDALMKASSSVQEDPDAQEASSKQDQQLLGESANRIFLDRCHPSRSHQKSSGLSSLRACSFSGLWFL